MNSIVTLLKVLTWSATFGVMFSGAVRVGPGSLHRVREQPALFARTMLALWVFVPAFTILVVMALGVRGTSATMLLLMSVCPGMPLLLSSTRSVRGSMVTALLALLLTTSTEPLLLPLWTRLLSAIQPVDLRVQPHHVLDVLLPTVFFPVLFGFFMRAAWARGAAALMRVADVVYVLSLGITLVVVLVQGAPLLPTVPWRAFVAAVIITIGDALIGFWAGRPDAQDQKALALATALGNPALALAVVEVSYPEKEAGALVAVYLIVRAVALAPFELWLKRLADVRAVRHAQQPAKQE